MTVEGTMVIPLLLFAWIGVIALTGSVKAWEMVQHTLTEYGLQMAVKAGAHPEIPTSVWLPEIRSRLEGMEALETGGVEAVSNFDFAGTPIETGDEWLRLEVRYQVELLKGLIPLPPLHMKNRVMVRAWTGHVPGEGSFDQSPMETAVYVAAHGRVYHKNRMCSHIRLRIYMVSKREAEAYPPCERCVGNSAYPGETCYVTETGEKYHSRLSCSGLKRQVERMTGTEAVRMGYGPCGRCGGE